jgi:hypothetical protein
VSFEALLDRRVTIIPSIFSDRDARNNEIREEGEPIPDVPTRREQSQATEQILTRSEQRQEWVYFFVVGTVLGGRDRIQDGDELLEVLGEPDVVDGRAGPHHLEAKAYLVTG